MNSVQILISIEPSGLVKVWMFPDWHNVCQLRRTTFPILFPVNYRAIVFIKGPERTLWIRESDRCDNGVPKSYDRFGKAIDAIMAFLNLMMDSGKR
jgi:hypothetical protein